MNRGNLPGFYWDEEKKRYFKIQANHLVPQTAKYSSGNVKQERRIAKKRKIEERNRLERDLHRVKLAPILHSPIVGNNGLGREHGAYGRFHRTTQDGDAALISHWNPKYVEVNVRGGHLQHAHYEPSSQTMITAVKSGILDRAVNFFSSEWDWEERCNDPRSFNNPVSPVVTTLNGKASISTRALDHGCCIVASTSGSPIQCIFIGFLPFKDAAGGSVQGERGVNLCLGVTYTSTIHPERELAATITRRGVYTIDLQSARVASKLLVDLDNEWPRCAANINWLDSNTVLYGAKETNYSIMLWDTRTANGSTSRFSVRERLTSVFNPSQQGSYHQRSPHEILASTNHRIHLFDVRMPRSSNQQGQPHQREAPVLSLPHVHGGPELQAVARGSLIAAVDRDNIVQMYSLRSGTKVTSLDLPEWQNRKLESPAVKNLMWYEDVQLGSTLQAVRGNGVVRWAWGK